MTEIPRIVQLLDPKVRLLQSYPILSDSYWKIVHVLLLLIFFLIESIQSRTGISRLEDDDNNHYMILP